LIIETLVIELDSLSKITSKSKINKQEPLHKTFYDYFVENALNKRKEPPKYTDKIIVFEHLIIPKQNSKNITSEIENYGMEFVREFTKRQYFELVDYEVVDEKTLKIMITP